MIGRGRMSWVAWAVVTAAVGVGAYLVGLHRSPTATLTGPGLVIDGQAGGTAYLGDRLPAPNSSPPTWAYGVPDLIQWTDRSGVLHDMSRPSCLRVGHMVAVKDMVAIRFDLPADGRTGTVVWLHC